MSACEDLSSILGCRARPSRLISRRGKSMNRNVGATTLAQDSARYVLVSYYHNLHSKVLLGISPPTKIVKFLNF